MSLPWHSGFDFGVFVLEFNVRFILRGASMQKSFLLTLILAFGTAVGAQAHKPDTSAPSKVTGEGTKTADGLQYWDIKVGTGPTAMEGQSAKVHYTGWLTNGKKFDSSVDRGQPFTVEPLGKAPVIKGWNEGIIGMKVGGKRQLRIPPDLAYGTNGYPGVIPANATLIFDVQLLSVK
jgi:FKBP-type peptidyl-prolyl cis-trans isomerase